MWGRLSTGCRVSPWHLGLDLLGCDHGSGYTAQGFNMRETGVAYGSLRLRDGIRATPSGSQLLCRIVGAPPLCAPARVFPGRTLLEGEGRVGSRASPQSQITPFGSGWWHGEVPIPAIRSRLAIPGADLLRRLWKTTPICARIGK
jgi:hypothetical protein